MAATIIKIINKVFVPEPPASSVAVAVVGTIEQIQLVATNRANWQRQFLHNDTGPLMILIPGTKLMLGQSSESQTNVVGRCHANSFPPAKNLPPEVFGNNRLLNLIPHCKKASRFEFGLSRYWDRCGNNLF